MKYLVIEKFGPGTGEWPTYAEWAGLSGYTAYYSIDGINRKSFFNPSSKEDWENCVNADFKLHLITNLDYARKVHSKFPDGEIIGVIENPELNHEEIPAGHTFLGYDIIDEYNSISLLTNWGGKEKGIQNLRLNEYALLDVSADAYQIKEVLRRANQEDPHAKNCEVWAVYRA